MEIKEINDRSDVINISLDDLVPKNHLIRKIDKSHNHLYDNCIYDIV